jgi:hypothetical protein
VSTELFFNGVMPVAVCHALCVNICSANIITDVSGVAPTALNANGCFEPHAANLVFD